MFLHKIPFLKLSSSVKTLGYYPFMDGLRAVAIFLVLGYHLNVFFNFKEMLGSAYNMVAVPMSLGFVGVDVFFVISGFLITGLLVKEGCPKPDIIRFYIRRFFKIMPSYLAVLLVTFVLFKLIKPLYSFDGATVFSYLLMIQNYTTVYHPLGHCWSIAVEGHYYVLYPLIVYLIYCISSGNLKIFRRNLIVALVVMIVLGNFIRFYCFNQIVIPHAPWPWQQTHVRFDALLMGGLIKCLEPFIVSRSKIIKKFISWGSLIIAVALIMSLQTMPASSIISFDYTKIYLFASLIVISCLCHAHFLCSFLSWYPLRWVGQNSYGIYLWHYPVLLLLVRLQQNHIDQSWLVVLYLILCVMAGAISTATIEKYFLTVRDRVKL